MRRLLTLLATYAGLLILTPVIFDIFRFAGLQFVSESLLAQHGWIPYLLTYTPVLLLLFIFLKATLRPAKNYGFRYSSEWLGVSVVIGLVSAVVIFLFGRVSTLGVPSDPSMLVALGYLLSMALVGPLVEEFFFRGFMQTALTKAINHRYSTHFAIALTVLFEVLFHGTESTWIQIGYLAFFGAAACIVYARTKSLLGPFIIHALGNGGALILFWVLV